MAKFFVVLFASACLLAVAFGDFDFDRVNNRLDEEISRNLQLALDRALAAADIDTCKTCWKYFGVISKDMRMNSKTPPTDYTIHIVCQALRVYGIDGDCASFLKAAYVNLTNYMGNQLDPSRVCPAALHCNPIEQYQTMMAYGSVREDGIGTCAVCKIWANTLVNLIKEFDKEGMDKLRNQLLIFCNRVRFPILRRMCQAGVQTVMEHIPQILKGGADEVCKLLKAC